MNNTFSGWDGLLATPNGSRARERVGVRFPDIVTAGKQTKRVVVWLSCVWSGQRSMYGVMCVVMVWCVPGAVALCVCRFLNLLTASCQRNLRSLVSSTCCLDGS